MDNLPPSPSPSPSVSTFIKYKLEPSSAGLKERTIRMVAPPLDPLLPPKFKHKRVPVYSGSPPFPLMHSPPRPVTVKDQEDWRIPPCVSNWKNPKGYTIPLDKRRGGAGDDVAINDNFAKLSEGLYVAEERAREATAIRLKVRREMVMRKNERREVELRELAKSARGEYGKESREDREGRVEREKTREERRRKRKITHSDLDMSERVALGIANNGGGGEEVMYDERLFNQEKGMDSGFADDDAVYNIYDRALFTTQSALTTLYKPKSNDDEMNEMEEEDLFGLKHFLTDLNSANKSIHN